MTSRPQNLQKNLRTEALAGYRKPDRDTQPDYYYPPYASTVKRSPSQPLVILPTTLSEVTGPLFGSDVIKANDSDLTPYPAAMRVFEQCMKLEAFDRAQPSKQPNANE